MPFIAAWKGRVPAGTVSDEPAIAMDILPTVAEAIGAKPPPALEGTSLWPVFRGGTLPERPLFWDRGRQRAVRRGRWKLLLDRNGKAQLYDLQTDPHDRHPLVNVPASREQLERMKQQLFDELEAGGGLNIPVRRPAGERLDQRKNKR